MIDLGTNDGNENNDENNNRILDFSSIKKFESSDSTLRKDNSMSEIYNGVPLKKDIQNSPEVKYKATGSLEKQHQDCDISNEPQDIQENS